MKFALDHLAAAGPMPLPAVTPLSRELRVVDQPLGLEQKDGLLGFGIAEALGEATGQLGHGSWAEGEQPQGRCPWGLGTL